MKKIIACFSLLIILFMPRMVWANNVTVANVAITNQNATAKTANINFNIAWNNSWRNAVNWDAVWVFAKYSTDGGVTWAHATLAAPTGSNVASLSNGNGATGYLVSPPTSSNSYPLGSGTSLEMIVPNESNSGLTGVFLERPTNVNGSGTVNTTAVPLVWNWGANYLSNASSTPITASTTARVQVFAIEMVYVPTGSFYAGDQATSTAAFRVSSSSVLPWFITSATGASYYYVSQGNSGETGTGSINIPSTFPNGYNAFYMMKYDLTQGQYRDFLNTLTLTQQQTRVATGSSLTAGSTVNKYVMSNGASVSYRNGIAVTNPIPISGPASFFCSLDGSTNGSADGEYIAVTYVSWMDDMAYAAWAGLRPFTELEYEKAARGPSSVDMGIGGEYAWGTTTYTAATGVSNSGINTETASNTNPSANIVVGNSGTGGPLRVGSLATASTTRTQAGASYWGIMDLSGNVWKESVTVGNSIGRQFLGSNGTGILATDGNATNADWPGYSSGEVSQATGSGYRGGAWNYAPAYARVSDRSLAAYTSPNRYNNFGARFARTSP